jgi:hypothetical protein
MINMCLPPLIESLQDGHIGQHRFSSALEEARTQ